jgi:DNA-binding response OmpR family regulator
MRLLIVEDEARLASHVRAAMSADGFVADHVGSCADARALIASTRYDAIVLDLGLPDGDGLALLSQVRSSGVAPPVLVLTARDSVDDRVAGLDAGADDYLTKPFAFAELAARIRALLRRPNAALGRELCCGRLRLDTIGREASIDGAPMRLARHEIGVLEVLLRRQGRVVPKDVLIEAIYDGDAAPETNAVPVHVHHLRRALLSGEAGCEVVTLRGLGYLIREIRQ